MAGIGKIALSRKSAYDNISKGTDRSGQIAYDMGNQKRRENVALGQQILGFMGQAAGAYKEKQESWDKFDLGAEKADVTLPEQTFTQKAGRILGITSPDLKSTYESGDTLFSGAELMNIGQKAELGTLESSLLKEGGGKYDINEMWGSKKPLNANKMAESSMLPGINAKGENVMTEQTVVPEIPQAVQGTVSSDQPSMYDNFKSSFSDQSGLFQSASKVEGDIGGADKYGQAGERRLGKYKGLDILKGEGLAGLFAGGGDTDTIDGGDSGEDETSSASVFSREALSGTDLETETQSNIDYAKTLLGEGDEPSTYPPELQSILSLNPQAEQQFRDSFTGDLSSQEGIAEAMKYAQSLQKLYPQGE